MSQTVMLPKTPLRRKSLAPDKLLAENDDEIEKENLRQEAHDRSQPSFTPFKTVGAEKRKSFDTQGTPKGGRLDNEKLQSLYGDCIKLANDNVDGPVPFPLSLSLYFYVYPPEIADPFGFIAFW